MNTRTLLFLALLLAGFATQALAQITITEADIRAQLGSQHTTTFYNATTFTGLQSIADQTGGGLTFNFNTATFDTGETYTAELITCTPDLPGCGDPDFASANFIAREVHTEGPVDSTALSFALLNSDGFYLLGGAARGDFDDTNPGNEDVVFKFTPALLSTKLPLTMGTTWTSSTVFSSDAFGTSFSFQMDEENTVEAWGRLQTPHGEADALKIRNLSITQFDVGGTVFIDSSLSIEFITKGNLNASLSLDEQGQVVGAGYGVSGGTGTANEKEPGVPTRIALAQNFPNPFNPSTTIPFTLKQAGQVSLVIYDLLGRDVAHLVNEMRPAGTYQAVWQAGDLPSGTYLYKLNVGGESITRMLTLLK